MIKTIYAKNIDIVVYLVFCLTVTLFVLVQTRAEEGIAISKDGVPISFSVYGQGEPTLVFVHGWCGNRSFWSKQVPYFEKRYRVITLDLAGHGGRSGMGMGWFYLSGSRDSIRHL